MIRSASNCATYACSVNRSNSVAVRTAVAAAAGLWRMSPKRGNYSLGHFLDITFLASMEAHRFVEGFVAEAKVNPSNGFCWQRLRHLHSDVFCLLNAGEVAHG